MKNLIRIFLASLMFVTSASYAGEWRLGIVAGQASIDDIEEACFVVCTEQDDTDTGLGINLSYMFNNIYGVEVGYFDFGEQSLTSRSFTGFSAITVSATIEASALYAAFRTTTRLSDKLSLTGRLGAADVDADIAVSSGFLSIEDSLSESEPIVGLSLDYQLTSKFSAGLRYDSIGEFDVVGLSLQAQF